MKFHEYFLHRVLTEESLKNFAIIKTNFPEADFWLIRKGSEETIGKPVKAYNPEHIGIKITSDQILPQYLFYVFEHLHASGYFRKLAKGMLKLVNIRVSDVENIQLS